MLGCTQSDVLFPNGCPAGFPLSELYYVPNSEITNVTASTPGAVPLVLGADGCPSYACMNSQGTSPIQTTQQTCPTMTPNGWLAIGATAAAIILLPGLLKILALPIGFFGLMFNGQQYQAQIQSDGSIKCVVTGASGM